MANSSDNVINAMIKEAISESATTSPVVRMWEDMSRSIFGEGKHDGANSELKAGNLDKTNPFEVFDMRPAPAAKLDNFSELNGVAKDNWLPNLELTDLKLSDSKK